MENTNIRVAEDIRRHGSNVPGIREPIDWFVESPTLTQAKLAAGHVITFTPRMEGVSAETNRLISSKPLAHGSPNVKVGEVAFSVPEWTAYRPRMGMRRAGKLNVCVIKPRARPRAALGMGIQNTISQDVAACERCGLTACAP